MLSLCLLLSAALAVQATPTARQFRTTALPDYALTYAPITYLHSGESWWPSDVAVHLQHVVPEFGDFALRGYTTTGSVTLDTLYEQDDAMYLTSEDRVEDDPAWLHAAYGRPDSTGYSDAPGTVIAVQKNETCVDVFYFYFYSYNRGGTVLGMTFDDHVGDWEHTMIRFVHGRPYSMYFSQHKAGSAYYWEVVEKDGHRPLAYISRGGHASYARAGTQEYTVALGLITDSTDDGFAWDIAQNYRGYWYDPSTGTFADAGASMGNEEEADEGTDWLLWGGHWGDEQYATDDPEHPDQYCLLGECKYMSGPTGPVAKNLGRTAMCEKEASCVIFPDIDELTEQS